MKPGLPPRLEVFAIHHEIAERHFFGRVQREDIESLCDQLAYRLRMPHNAFRELARSVGPNWRALSRPFFASQTAAALRYLEVTGTPGVVISQRSLRARGEAWVWPDAAELRRLAKARSLPREVRRHRITDRPGSVVLVAA